MAGLGDGIVKIWDVLKKNEVVRSFKASNNSSAAITSIQLNSSKTILGASNIKGSVNLFPVTDLMN